MSNPAVLSLASLDAADDVGYRFEIEDNIGEAIHVHYKEMRLDLTVQEFDQIAGRMEKAIDQIVGVEGFSCRDFDPVHLVGLSGLLADLEKITYDEVFLADLLVDTYDEKGQEVLRPLAESRVLKALHGIAAENDRRKQVNYYDAGLLRRQTNSERLAYNLRQVREHGYPAGKQLITLFDNQNRIYDGQHRAACLYFLYGNQKVKVRRMWFRNFVPLQEQEKGSKTEYFPLDDRICIQGIGKMREISIDLSALFTDRSEWKAVWKRGSDV
ncbi:MAG: hypothetical protein K2N87_15910 [Eubacterium sp.]|nr:hypothetical protein [Eubacterium sp.]